MEINRKPLKFTIYAFIGVAWIGSMAYLFSGSHAKQFIPTPSASAVKSNRAIVSEWMGLYMGDKKIGYDYEQMLPLKNGFSFKKRMFMRIMLLGQEKNITTIVDSTTDDNYNLKHIDFSLKTSGIEIAAAGTVKGNVLTVDINGPAGKTTQSFTLKEPIISSDGIVMRIVQDGFGRSDYNFHIFDPTIRQMMPVHVTVLGKETKKIMNSPVDTFKLEVTIKDMKETMWVTPQGETVEEISPLGFRAVIEPKAIALTKGWGNEPVDLISSTAIKAGGLPVTYPASAIRIVAYITGLSKEEFLPSFTFQTVQNHLVSITTPTHIGTYKLPFKGNIVLRGDLKSTPIINSDNSAIIAKAKSILSGETDAKKAVGLLNQWVYSHVKDSFMVALPRSIDILSKPRGDCKAHTILFTALARAAGIPTKMAMGVVLRNDGYFYYHAWALVYLNGWVPVDPTFGEFPADAGHVILASGSLSNWLDILGVVGNLKIDIMRAEYKKSNK